MSTFSVGSGRGRSSSRFEDLRGGAVLAVPLHLLEQVVVEALHPHRQALHATLERPEDLVVQVVGVGLGRHLVDVEQVARQVDRGGQLVDQHRGRAAADVHVVEAVAEVGHHPHLLAQRAK
jgi:hypothetical protein